MPTSGRLRPRDTQNTQELTLAPNRRIFTRRLFTRRTLIYLTLALLALTLLIAMITTLQRRILFPREYVPAPPAGMPQPPGLSRLDVTHEHGQSEGWLLPGDGVTATHPGPVVFFAHGNGELIDYAAPLLEPYRRRGISVALLEYRGYHRSGGTPSEAALVADLIAFYDLVMARPDTTLAFAHGRSLGGGVVCGLAAHRPLAALLLESTFRSVRLIARRFLLPGFLVADPFDNEAMLRTFDRPTLVMHGRRDEIIPFDHGETLASVARDATFVAFDSGHNDMPQGAAYWAAIDALLARAGLIPPK